MPTIIDDATIEYVEVLAKLELSAAQREQAKKDMSTMLDYIDMMQELDTSDVKPVSHIFPVENVFRKDITLGDDLDGSVQSLQNAPRQKDNMFVVPKAITETRTE